MEKENQPIINDRLPVMDPALARSLKRTRLEVILGFVVAGCLFLSMVTLDSKIDLIIVLQAFGLVGSFFLICFSMVTLAALLKMKKALIFFYLFLGLGMIGLISFVIASLFMVGYSWSQVPTNMVFWIAAGYNGGMVLLAIAIIFLALVFWNFGSKTGVKELKLMGLITIALPLIILRAQGYFVGVGFFVYCMASAYSFYRISAGIKK